MKLRQIKVNIPKKNLSQKNLKDLLNSSEETNASKSKSNFTNIGTVCPICQVPLKLLSGLVSSSHHLATCGANPVREHLQPCPDGVNCANDRIEHYAENDHSSLARNRDLGLLGQTTVVHINQNCGFSDSLFNSQNSLIPKFASTRMDFSENDSLSKSKYISPIKTVRRTVPSQQTKCRLCERTFLSENALEEHVCAQKENIATPSPRRISPQVNTERQRRFFKEVASDSSKNDTTSLMHWLRSSKMHPNVSDQNTDECSMSKELRNNIDNAINVVDQNVNNSKSSPVTGPSGLNNNLMNRGEKNRAIDTKRTTSSNMSLEPPISDVDVDRIDCNSSSPIKVFAEKDSDELELNLDLDPKIHCTKLRLKVPLKKSEDGKELPVQVSANYNEMSKAQVESRNGGSSYLSGKERDSLSSKQPEVVAQWKNIFNRADSNAKKEVRNTQIDNQNKLNNKKCPPYKKIHGTDFAVDAFSYGEIPGVTYYLLTHFHYDHYSGLSKNWKKKIVCSSITKRLAASSLGVNEDLMITLDPGDREKESRTFGNCELTAIDANHCPGSIMFVMRLTSGVTILHVGDFRASQEMEEGPIFWDRIKIDKLYLDTTYCKPEYDFPAQADVINRSVELVGEFISSNPNTVVMVGAYTVGKERIFKAIAEDLKSKVWGDKRRVKTWRCLNDPAILNRVENDRNRAQVQVVMNNLISWPKLLAELDKLGGKWNHVLGVKPTGWAHSKGEDKELSLANIKIVTRGHVSILEVPYSEHSSYSELKRFVQYLRIGSERDIIPTVNLRNRENMAHMFRQWISERKEKGPESQ